MVPQFGWSKKRNRFHPVPVIRNTPHGTRLSLTRQEFHEARTNDLRPPLLSPAAVALAGIGLAQGQARGAAGFCLFVGSIGPRDSEHYAGEIGRFPFRTSVACPSSIHHCLGSATADEERNQSQRQRSE